MKRVSLGINLAVLVAVLFIACERKNEQPPIPVKNVVVEPPIKEVVIGQQVWMAENLSVVKFRNGDSVPQAKTPEEWVKAAVNNQPAWCYYNNDPGLNSQYGKLYNWHAVNDPRGLAPVGWHIPTDSAWTILSDYLGGMFSAGKKMKTVSGWFSDFGYGNGNNISGFSGLPGGRRNQTGLFNEVELMGVWWSATVENNNKAWSYLLTFNYDYLIRGTFDNGFGLSVRCIKD